MCALRYSLRADGANVTAAAQCPARVEAREPCRYPTRREGFCWRHAPDDPDHPRAVDRTRWCSHRLPRLGALCQNCVMQGSFYCADHDPRHRPSLPRPELEARAVLIAAVGGNPSSLALLLGRLVADNATTWAGLLRVARREGLAQ